MARNFLTMLTLGALAAAFAAAAQTASDAHTLASGGKAVADPFVGMTYRLVGPFRGGRATGVAGVAGDPTTFYFGAAAGGIWKTVDAGVSWKPLWDKFPEASATVGAIAVARSNPNVIYVGTGEANIRGDVAVGNGLFKSTDAGKTWKYAGLKDTQVIGRIIVSPANPDVVFVAALGHTFGDNAERGIFKSTDGGSSWKKVLYVDEKTGGIDVAFDPSDPKVLYAGMWQAYRKPWIMESGGPGSGLYKSADGGESWTRLSGGGLPEGILGRINVAPTSNAKRVYAMIEAKKGGLYRSDDGAKTWTLINDKNAYRQRAWYFNTLFADPKSADTLYVLNTGLYRSIDGGKTFKPLRTRHGDNHELWIDPTDPRHMINGNDGGANISLDNGETWSTENGQPTGQFYHVATDNQFPWRILGDQQDNSSVSIASAGAAGGVGIEDYTAVGGGESGFILPDPTDPDIVYGGGYDAELTRYDKRTGQTRQITPWPRNTMGWPADLLKYRFQWTAPIMVSQYAPHALYFGAQVLFRSLDQGQSWSVISPDLTRNDKSKQLSSGGPLTKDNTSVETYDTIFAVAESPKQKDLIWTGSDDGLVHLTRDGGAHWTDVTPKTMPPWATVDLIDPDPNDPASAYLAADRHRLDDAKPYAFATHDYGQTWTPITTGIPADAYLHVIRADPERKSLLYAGAERGLFVSFDDGAHWKPLQLNLPITPVHDLTFHGASLVVATHGRAFWVLDDLSPLRQWTDALPQEKAHLFRPVPANHTTFKTSPGVLREAGGANPPAGAVITYWLSPSFGAPRPAEDAKPPEKEEKAPAPDPLDQKVKVEILDAEGRVIRVFPDPEASRPVGGRLEAKATAAAASVAGSEDADEEEDTRAPKPVKVPHLAGLNSFVWDLRYPNALAIPNSPLWSGSVAGPKALPGRYQVRLTVDGVSQTQPFDIVPDPRVQTTPAQLKQQFDLHMAINAELTAVHAAVLDIRAARERLHATVAAEAGHPGAVQRTAAAEALDRRMTAIEEALIQPRARASEDALNYPVKLNNMLAALAGLVADGDHPPTDQDRAMFEELRGECEGQLTAWMVLKSGDIRAFASAGT